MARATNKAIGLLHHLATSSRRARNLLTPIGAGIFASFICLVIFVALATDRWLGLAPLPPRPYHLITALPLLAAGAFLAGWAFIKFIKAKGTPVPFNPPPKLVITGPYAYSRNPMLSGIFLLLFGLGLILQSVSMVCFFGPVFLGLNYWELKAIEEPELIKRLGDEYSSYRDKTPMFFPGWRGHR